ncbi:MAG: 16S rRNA (cytosine(1402)-N(4))-methyltransferase RsmH [Minisyncoccia bacterium]|jgi:16S rRNA (cytosine1402-N4)-methyltransferase
MHTPVLLKEILHYLDPKPGDFIIDGTVDGGGHAEAIVKKIMPGGLFLGVDWDRGMIEAREAHRIYGGRERYVQGNYADLSAILAREKLGKADGLFLDLGFSSEQLVRSGKGFSFSEDAWDEPLIMTYDDTRPPVSEILRGLCEEELANIIFELGGERFSRRIAKAIKERGRKKPIATSGELAEVVRGAVPKNYERGRIDPATRTFQALRIVANDELGNLQSVLHHLTEILKPGGRVVIATFHSLEDRIVKQSFQVLAKEQKIEILTKKPLTASREEVIQNPRSRSAKLRAARMQ